MSKPIVKFAFYRTHPKDTLGEPVYGGKRSDGLERTYFGPDFKKAKQMVDSARKSEREYRLDQFTYTKLDGEVQCDVRTLYRTPVNTNRNKGKTDRRKTLKQMSSAERKAHRQKWQANQKK